MVCHVYDESDAILGIRDSTCPPKVIDSSKDQECSYGSNSEDKHEGVANSSDQPSFSTDKDNESCVSEPNDIPKNEQRRTGDKERVRNDGAQLEETDTNSSPPLKRRRTAKEKRKVIVIHHSNEC